VAGTTFTTKTKQSERQTPRYVGFALDRVFHDNEQGQRPLYLCPMSPLSDFHFIP
jgi:hypothetical protein